MTAALIAKLESASEGSRELDARIWMALNDPEPANYFAGIGMEMWFDGTPCEVLSTSSGLSATHELKPAMGKVTTSIDAALALAERLLPGEGTMCLWLACVSSNHPDEIPRLLCAALLRASAAEGAGE